MGEADAALVERDQVTRVRDRAEQLGELFGERNRRLPGAARERHDRVLRFADGGAVAADRERDRSRRAPARIERHGEVAAGEVIAVATGCKRNLRLGLRGRRHCADANRHECAGELGELHFSESTCRGSRTRHRTPWQAAR
jgi:hypothetical protein